MRPARRRRFCTVLATGALVLHAATASAGTFYVDADSPAGDCSQATPCPTIASAVSAARGTVEADTINIAAGL